MPASDVNRLEAGRDDEMGDCAIVAMCAYLGLSYTEVIRAATIHDDDMGRLGLWRKTIQRIAATFGEPLLIRRQFDWDEDYGILCGSGHAAVLRNGLVLDRLTVWEWRDWLAYQKDAPSDCVLLVSRGTNETPGHQRVSRGR